MRIPTFRSSIRNEVVEKDVFRFDYILKSGKKGKHFLFDQSKLSSYMNSSTDDDAFLTMEEKVKYNEIFSHVVVLPNLPAKKDYIDTLSFGEQKKLFRIYMSMVDQYEVDSASVEAH